MNLGNIIRELERIESDEIAALDKNELESRLSDLETEAEQLRGCSIEELQDAISELVYNIHSLYTEV